MKEMVLANRYAKALVDLGLEEKCLERFKDEMGRLKKAIQLEPQLLKVLNYRELSFAKREAIVGQLSQTLMLTDPVRNILRLLLKRERISLIPSVIEAFNQGVRLVEKVVVAKVTVANKNAATQLSSQLKTALERMTGKKVEFDIKEDVGLIGGLQVRVGDAIYDASIKGELERIQENWR